jgi:DNA-binding NarL/FixJ family response regulator
MHREEPIWGDSETPRELPANLDTASEVAEAREAFGRLRDFLPEDRHSILELKAEGLSSKDIGAKLGISERTVQRVLEELRRRVELEWEG